MGNTGQRSNSPRAEGVTLTVQTLSSKQVMRYCMGELVVPKIVVRCVGVVLVPIQHDCSFSAIPSKRLLRLCTTSSDIFSSSSNPRQPKYYRFLFDSSSSISYSSSVFSYGACPPLLRGGKIVDGIPMEK